MINSVVFDKSRLFAVRIMKLYKLLTSERHEPIISKQIARSGTSIGANITEAEYAVSRKDFLHKINLALKEAEETNYWLYVLFNSEYINSREYESIHSECCELCAMLTSIIVSTKKSLEKELLNKKKVNSETVSSEQ